jgi:hypothetical protein
VRFQGTRPKKVLPTWGIFPLKSKFLDFLGIVKESLNRAFYVKYHFVLVWAGNLVLTVRELVNDTYRGL